MANSEFPEHLLDQVLADPEAMEVLQQFANRQGIATSVSEMSRTELSLLAGAVMAEARARNAASESNASDDGSDLPEGLTEAVFEDPRAQEILKDLALAHGWTDPPSELPDAIKRMFVKLLIDQGVLGVEETPGQGRPPNPDGDANTG